MIWHEQYRLKTLDSLNLLRRMRGLQRMDNARGPLHSQPPSRRQPRHNRFL